MNQDVKQFCVSFTEVFYVKACWLIKVEFVSVYYTFDINHMHLLLHEKPKIYQTDVQYIKLTIYVQLLTPDDDIFLVSLL